MRLPSCTASVLSLLVLLAAPAGAGTTAEDALLRAGEQIGRAHV